MAEDKQDGRKNNGRFAGTTKNKIQGKLAEKKDNFGSAKQKKNRFQTESMEEFLKIREGETFEQWNKRTSPKRIHGVNKNNNLKIAKLGKVVIDRERLTGMAKEKQVRIRHKFIERPYDFLENYAFIMRWASIRYGISKDDIEIAFFFYGKGMFTKDEFTRVCVQLGTVKGVWARFVSKPYITSAVLVTKDNVVKEMEYYQLTAEFSRLLLAVYGGLSKVNKLTLTIRSSAQYKRNVVHKELNDFLEQLNREVDETIKGELTPHFEKKTEE